VGRVTRALARLVLVSTAALALAGAAAPSAGATPVLGQLQGLPGCWSETGSGGDCTDGHDLLGALAAVVSPDGANVYVASGTSVAVNSYSRDPATGALAQLPGTDGCISQDGSGGACQDGHGFASFNHMVISPDGRNVYATSFFGSSVVVFNRDPASGKLTQPAGTDGCVSESGGACADGRGLGETRGIAISPDGRFVYAMSSQYDSVTTFARDTGTGKLTQLDGADGCIVENPAANASVNACRDGKGLDGANGGTVAPDGKQLYSVAFVSDSVAVLDRDPTTGVLTQSSGTDACVSQGGVAGCTAGRGLDSATDAAVSGDDKNVYVVAGVSDSIAVFSRAGTGDITQLGGVDGCLANSGDGVNCADAAVLDGPNTIRFAANDRDGYVSVQTDDGVVRVTRDPASGKLAEVTGPAGCITETGTGGACTDGRGLDSAQTVALSPDGGNVYVPGYDSSTLAVLIRGERPGCNDVSATVPYQTATAVPLPCADAGGDALTYEIVAGPAHGTLGAPAGGSVSYTPATGYFGPDSLTFRVVAEDGSSNVATVALTVAGPPGKCVLALAGGSGPDTLTGTVFGDRISGSSGNDKLNGLGGDDCLDGGAGNDRASGGDGVDSVKGSTGNDRLSGGNGRDKLNGGAGGDSASGGADDDAVAGGSGNDRLSGGSGKDKLTDVAGDDRLNGGAGRDAYSAGPGRDTISARDGEKDKVRCGKGRDTVSADRRDSGRR
jgi:Ca2+-binding RTX toxin-like protein